MRFVKFLLVIVFAGAIGFYYFVYVTSPQATAYFLSSERESAKLARREVVLPDGMHYVYLEGGRGEPLMLLHGFGSDKDGFVRSAKWLASHYHVIIPDLLGFGESSHPKDADYSSAPQAERMRALAQSLGIEKLHLGGSSMGGQIAMAYAAAHPAEVESMWLLDPAGIWSAPQSELAKIIENHDHNPLLIRNGDDYVSAFHFVMSKPPFIPRPILTVLAQNSINNEKLSEQIFDQIVNDSVEKRVDGLKTPTLIVWGDQDRVIHYLTAEILSKLLPESRVIIMKGIGHLPMVEVPEECAEDYLHFRFKLQAPE